MPSNAPDLNFGPSERYLPGKKLLEGDVLTLNILDFEKDEVDTDFGSKLEFHINVLSSSTDAVKPGKYTWRTVAAAARKVHAYYCETDITIYDHWVWQLTVMENGVSLKTLNSVVSEDGVVRLASKQNENITTHGTPAPGNTAPGDGEHVL